jgi:hypothetical protein
MSECFFIPLKINLTMDEIIAIVATLECLANIFESSECKDKATELRRLIQRLETEAQTAVVETASS